MFERIRNRRNLFVLTRLLLALAVMVGHFFTIFGIEGATGEIGPFVAGMSVLAFFFLSGFLITESCSRVSPIDFLLKRSIRIFPALIVSLILTALVFAPAIAIFSGDPLFTLDNLTYLDNVFLPLSLQHTIGDVISSFPEPGSINGSLWTLPVEFRLYLVSLAISLMTSRWIKMEKFGGLLVYSVFLASIVFGFSPTAQSELGFYSFSVSVYAFGAFVSAFDKLDFPELVSWLVFSSGVVFAAFLGVQYLSMFVILVCFIPEIKRPAVPDISYPLYVIAFPLTQLHFAIFGQVSNALGFAVLALVPLGLVAVFLSYHINKHVELPIRNRLKNIR